MTHGLVNGSVGEGVELGDLVFYSNYTNYQSQFMALNDLMVDNGQIVFYSCSLGDQPAMLNQIAAWTNTDIFACADNVSIQYYVPLGWTWNHDYWCWHPTYADWFVQVGCDFHEAGHIYILQHPIETVFERSWRFL